MFYFLLAILLFAASIAVHIQYCRHTTKSGLQAKAFVLIAVIFACIYATAVFFMTGSMNEHSPWGMPFKITSGIIYMLLIPIYLAFYVLTQLTSPSKKILGALTQKGVLSYNEIVSVIKKEEFIDSRLSDLCASGCVRCHEGKYALTPDGQKIAAVLDLMQLVLGRNVGG